MTITELMNIPNGMSVQEYEVLLERKIKLRKQLKKTQDDIYSEEDSLEVLSDEVGTEIYIKHLKKKGQLEQKLSRKLKEYNEVLQRLNE